MQLDKLKTLILNGTNQREAYIYSTMPLVLMPPQKTEDKEIVFG